MKQKLDINLRFLVYREDNVWLAHCLEMDIVAEGTTPRLAVSDLIDLCNFQVETALKDGDLQSIFRPAPAATWRLFFMSRTRAALTKRQGQSPRSRSTNGAKLVKRIEARELELV